MTKLKLFLIPGLDGTGLLFQPLLNELNDIDATVIPLPSEGPQDYQTLKDYVASKLPKEEPYVVLVESFAGPIGYLLARQHLPSLKGVAFIATFLEPPSLSKSGIVRSLPFSALVNLPLSPIGIKQFFLGKDAPKSLIELFRKSVGSIPKNLLNIRLETVSKLDLKLEPLDLSATYLQAMNDYLVPLKALEAFKKVAPNIEVTQLNAPHFILQNKPRESAKILSGWLDKVTSECESAA